MSPAFQFPGRAALGRLKRRLCSQTADPNAVETREQEAARRIADGQPVVQTVVDGIELLVDLRDGGVGLPMFQTGSYEPAERALMERTLRRGMTVVDVGANIGYMTLLAAQLVGDAGRVFSLEPHPDNRALLERNRSLHSLSSVVVLPFAAGAEAGTLTMHCSPGNFGDHRCYSASEGEEGRRVQIEVEVRPLDDVIPPGTAVDFLKVDVQGFEPYVVAGAERLFAESPQLTLLMEYWPYSIRAAGGDEIALLNRLVDHGLSPSLLRQDGTTEPITLEQLRVHPQLDDRREWYERWVNLVLRRPDAATNP